MGKNQVHVDAELEEILPTFLENRKKDVLLMQSALVKSDFESIELLVIKCVAQVLDMELKNLAKWRQN